VADKDTATPIASKRSGKRLRTPAGAGAAERTPTKVTIQLSPHAPSPDWIASLDAPAAALQKKEPPMNATNFAEKFKDASFDQASTLLTNAFDGAAKNVQAFSDAYAAGLQGAEQVRAHLLESASAALNEQIAAAAQFGKVQSAYEALRLHQQLVREAFEAQAARARSLGEVLWAAWQASAKPLTERYAEVSENAAV
jgi:hypothetical protein